MVYNMAPAYAAAKYDLVWISPGGILTSTTTLLDLSRKLEPPDVGMVHQTPFYAYQSGFLGSLEKVRFGCSISRNQIALNQLGIVYSIGMSHVFNKSLIDEVGGLAY
ncbi:Ceramide glucosyltransferase [Fasciola hepatica]|uniref:Ceramide glucosyltransferase n=1 Tax=Fasciola hepatica TaxID=6192 RepID=A0A4E0R3H4_FASHE|nr:Ceramide glucosyltransferase [Fasciola hepatica]